MNWTALQAVAETIGAAGVVVSLIYLAVQIRNNTRMTQAATLMRSVELMQASRRALWANEDGARMWNAAIAGVEYDDPLLNSRIRLLWTEISRSHEAIFFQWQAGHLPESNWRGWVEETRLVWSTPGGRMALGVYESLGWLDPAFVSWIKKLQQTTPPAYLLEFRDRWSAAARRDARVQQRS